jgi:hypothetical protein
VSLENDDIKDQKLYLLMDVLKKEVINDLMMNLKPNRDQNQFTSEYYAFDLLYEDLRPIFSKSKVYRKVVKRMADFEFVNSNKGRMIYLLNRSTALTAENLIALTFLRVRESIQLNKNFAARYLPPGYSPNYKLLDRIFNADYRLLENLIFEKDIVYTSTCILGGVTGPVGRYKIGNYEIEIRAISSEEPNLREVRASYKRVINKEQVIFARRTIWWDSDNAKDEFLELVAILGLMNPNLRISPLYPKMEIELLTFPFQDYYSNEKIKIEALARAEYSYMMNGFECLDISKQIRNVEGLWQEINSLGGNERDRIMSALRRFAMGTLRRNLNDSIVDYATSLEALLIEREANPEISYRLRLRSAVLTKDPLKTMKFIGKLYDWRSKTLHRNTKIDEDSAGFLFDARAVLSEIFQEYVRISLSSGNETAISAIDKAIIDNAQSKLPGEKDPDRGN